MEKLQSALDKARADREQNAERSSEAAAPRVAAGADAWALLPEAELDPEHMTRNRVVSHAYTRDAAPFDILRTKLVLQMRKHGWRRLAITSATPVCGKTTVTCNMALGLSRQEEMRAIFMDLDLRNPSMARMLGVEPPRDVTGLLEGEVPFAEQAVRVKDAVALSLTQRSVADPTRYLLGQKTEDTLSKLEVDFAPDLMIFDTAPVMVSDDTRAFLNQVDCAMIVACAERTTMKQIDACEREIAEQTNVLGVVLNQARFGEEETGYGYGYGY